MRQATSTLIVFLMVLTGTRVFAQTVNPSDNLSLRFADGIVAIAESDVITVDDVRREVAPYIPQMQRAKPATRRISTTSSRACRITSFRI